MHFAHPKLIVILSFLDLRRILHLIGYGVHKRRVRQDQVMEPEME